MHKHRLSGILSAVFLAALASAGAQGLRPQEGNLKVGDTAPDFTVQDVEGKKTVKLSALKGKPVVLIFGSCT